MSRKTKMRKCKTCWYYTECRHHDFDGWTCERCWLPAGEWHGVRPNVEVVNGITAMLKRMYSKRSVRR